MDESSDDLVYLDHNATTPVMPEAVEAMLPYLREDFGNPSSTHRCGRSARRAVDRARRRVATLIGASPGEIIFTSGGTESNNIAILGSMNDDKKSGEIITSVVEHPAVSAPCDWLEKQGHRVHRIGVDRGGCVDVQQAIGKIGPETDLVTIMHSNNETGVVQRLEPIIDRAREQNAIVHTDASQSVGKVPIDVDKSNVDLLTIAGHKIYGPKGVGALYIREGIEVAPVLRGAGHEQGLRPGTENVASIVALGKACEVVSQRGQKERNRIAGLRDLLEQKLVDGIDPVAVNGDRERRLPNTLNISMPGVRATEVLARAPEICASTGSACKEEGPSPSPVLKAMGLSDDEARGALRLSLGCDNHRDEIIYAAKLLVDAWSEAINS